MYGLNGSVMFLSQKETEVQWICDVSYGNGEIAIGREKKGREKKEEKKHPDRSVTLLAGGPGLF